MSVERIFYCEGPDCERHVRTPSTQPPTFLVVIEEGQERHFCGWDCLLRHAATKEPETIVFPGDQALGMDGDS